MLRKFGWWAAGVGLAFVGVSISLLLLALLITAFPPMEEAHIAFALVGIAAGLVLSCAALAVPGYVAARYGGGGELMGLAVGAASGAILIAITAVLRTVAFMDLPTENPPPLWLTIAPEAVLLILPPTIGGRWARYATEREEGQTQSPAMEA